MISFIKVFFIFLLSLNLFSSDNIIDSITLTKVKKLILKEEEIAFAYKKYILEKGTNPTSLSTLIESAYLPKGFSTINPFGKEIKFDTTIPYKLEASIPDNIDLKSNLFDYYYSDKYRVYTKSPLSINNNKIEIVLSPKEKFIYSKKADITTIKANAINKYYLDANSILHWYGDSGIYKFSLARDLIIDEDVVMLNSDGTVNSAFKSMIADVSFSGQTILRKNKTTNKAEEYFLIDDNTIIKKNIVASKSTLALLQFGKQSGGMIVNGDIYTWGNNTNRITGINLDTYTNKEGSKNTNTSKKPVIATLVRAKAKIYEDNILDGKDLSKFSSENYFSSPFRPRFVDLFSSTLHGTCGITTEGALYCGGITANNQDYIFKKVETNSESNPSEMLYRSTYFDGITNKAVKVFANNQLWLILAEDGYIYRWGTEKKFKNGFSGNGNKKFRNNKNYDNEDPEKITENIASVKFTDISYIFGDGYKKMGALSNEKDIYIWGMDSENTSKMKCSEISEMDLCTPTKVNTLTSNLTDELTFESIKGGIKSFIALSTDGNYYKISQAKNSKIDVTKIKNGSDDLPADLLSIDLTKDGKVVYVNKDNKLISTHFDSFDTTFKNTINGMLWKNIKVLDDVNDAMCGINTDNQMYCWGIQSYYSSINPEENTYMLPIFNTNLYDSSKDYLVAEGGDSNFLTGMIAGSSQSTSIDGINNPFSMKYPTYISGFNYDFIFK